jgi:hypothetical protein
MSSDRTESGHIPSENASGSPAEPQPQREVPPSAAGGRPDVPVPSASPVSPRQREDLYESPEYEYEPPRPGPRYRRRREGDATGGWIPYKNPMALAAYYCGVFGLISCFVLLGIFGILPIILGIQGLKHARQYPEARGEVHAIIGIVLGSLEVITFLVEVVLVMLLIFSASFRW